MMWLDTLCALRSTGGLESKPHQHIKHFKGRMVKKPHLLPYKSNVKKCFNATIAGIFKAVLGLQVSKPHLLPQMPLPARSVSTGCWLSPVLQAV